MSTGTRPPRPSPSATAPKFAARARQVRRRSRRPVVLTVLGVVLVVALATFAWAGPLLVARHVQVKGVDGDRIAAVRDAADVAPGQRLLRLDSDGVRRRVHGLPFVAQVSVHRRWPSTVVIEIEARTPAAAVPLGGQAAGGQGFRIVDADGVGFTTVAAVPDGLPVITFTGSGDGGPTVAAALQVLAGMPGGLRADVSKVSASSPQDIALRVGKATVRWGGPDDTARKAEVFEVLRRTKAKTYDVSSPETPVLR